MEEFGLKFEKQDDSPLLSSKFTSGSTQLKISGMTCGSCVAAIEKGLKSQEGIFKVIVALLAERAVIEFDEKIWSVDKLIEEVEDMGFEAEVVVVTEIDLIILQVYGMKTGNDVDSLEENLLSTIGILGVQIDLTAAKISISFDPLIILGPRDLVGLVKNIGYDSTLSSDSNLLQLRSLARTKEVQSWKRSFKVSLFFAIPVFLLAMIFPMLGGGFRAFVNWKLMRGIYFGDLLCLLLTLPVQFGVGRRFYISCYKALKHGSATMDVLIVLGTTLSFTFSIVSMLTAPFSSNPSYHPKVFFETCTMLITFISFGRYLENLAKGQTSLALSKLMGLTPNQTTIYSTPSMTTELLIPTELVQLNDIVKILPGDKIPADGIIIRGNSTIDESMITGEPLPITKIVGNEIIAGTVNGLGSFDFKVLRAGSQTSLAQIVKLVEVAQTDKAPIQEFADTVAGYFVPSVIILSLFTFIAWMIISHLGFMKLPMIFMKEGETKLMICLKLCISVVVVACPCALGLSTPTAVMVGTGVGAQNGILIKGAGPLEASHLVDRVILDKTGTITQGKMEVDDIYWCEQETQIGLEGKQEILKAITISEKRSEHPLAKAVSDWALLNLGIGAEQELEKLEILEFESITGFGIKTVLFGDFSHLSENKLGKNKLKVVIGNEKFLLQENSITLTSTQQSFMTRASSSGKTCILISLNSTLYCVLSITDKIKLEAKQAIEGLRWLGCQVYLVTGDGELTAKAIGNQVGIEEDCIFAGVSPNGKRSIVEKMQKEGKGHRVAMVGDGINDSPALAIADVGIALCTGTDIAIEAADIVLMRSDLLDVVAALHLSKRIFKQIRINFLWATIYNLIGIPLAMGFFLPWGYHLHPMMAGAAMAFSSVSVVGSSLTLKWWKRPKIAMRISQQEKEISLMKKVSNLIQEVRGGSSRKRERSRMESEYHVIGGDEEDFISLERH